MPRLLLDLTPLRAVAYRRLWIGTSLTGIGTQLTTVAVGLQIYDLTGSTFAVGLVGLMSLGPLIVLGLYGGVLVDVIDRRRVIVAATAAMFVVAVAFAAQALAGGAQVGLLYGLIAAQSGLFGLNSTARSASIPRLLPQDLLPAANALNSLSFGLGMSAGPLLGALLVASVGYAAAYTADAVVVAVAVISLIGLPAMVPTERGQRAGLASLVEGFRFLGTRPNVRMTFLLDIAAMVLAMPRVLFPAVGTLAIGGGATTVGVLAASAAVGSMLAGLLSGPLGAIRWQGRAVVVSVIVWGAAVTGFGVVVLSVRTGPDGERVLWALVAASALLVLAGAADAVSAVFRTTILQAATPDELRGRLQGVFVVVVAGGPRLGDVVLGTVAGVTTEAVAGIAGGLACIVVVIALILGQRRFLRYDARDPQP